MVGRLVQEVINTGEKDLARFVTREAGKIKGKF
jgi:hypothetical protein